MAKKTTAITTITDEKFIELDKLIDDSNLVKVAGLGKMKAAFQLATGMQNLREAITSEIMAPIMALQGTPVGFDTDRSKNEDGFKEYDEETVKDCVIIALMTGVELVNNQFNIIAGRPYITKNGMHHLVKGLHLKEFKYTLGIPDRVDEKKALVQGVASWIRSDGVEQKIDRDFVIRANKGMMDEALLGKANRKLHAVVLELATNFIAADGEVGDTMPPERKRVESKATTSLPMPKPEVDPETGQEIPDHVGQPDNGKLL